MPKASESLATSAASIAAYVELNAKKSAAEPTKITAIAEKAILNQTAEKQSSLSKKEVKQKTFPPLDYPEVIVGMIHGYTPKIEIAKDKSKSDELIEFHPRAENYISRSISRRNKETKAQAEINLIHDLEVQKSLLLKEHPELKTSVTFMTKKSLQEQVLLLRKGLLLTENPEFGPAAAAWKRQNITLEQQVVRLNLLRTYAFGTDKWVKHFGQPIVEKVPVLPEDIFEILFANDAEDPTKKVIDTHVLVLVPKAVTVDGKPTDISLKTLGDLAKTPKNSEHKTKYRHDRIYARKHENTLVGQSHWVLMRKEVLPESREQTYDDQKELVEQKYSKKAGAPHFLPNAVDAAACCFLTYISTGIRLFESDDKIGWTYTRCEEKVDGAYPIVVGGFAPAGLSVYGSTVDSVSFGVAPARKFL